MNFKFFALILIFSNLFLVKAQQLNIKIDEQNARLNESIHPNATASIENLPVLPAMLNTEASVVEEITENTLSNGLITSTDVPFYRELEKVAANNKSNYIHSETNTVFPHLIEDFERFQLISSVNQPGKVDVIYKSRK